MRRIDARRKNASAFLLASKSFARPSPGRRAATLSFFGTSATMASVVINLGGVDDALRREASVEDLQH
jgi:hypothetical protein